MAHPGGESSNPEEALLEELADWATELNRLDSPALRTNKGVKP